MSDTDTDEDSVLVYMARSDALKVANFLDAYGDEDDQEIAAKIRFQAKWNRNIDELTPCND